MDSPLRIARLKTNKTLTEVAEANGLTKGTLSRFETCALKPSPEMAERLARYYGTVSEIEILYPERFTGVSEGAAA